MFCRNCGKELPENTRFCNDCGAPQYVETTQSEGGTQATKQDQNVREVQFQNVPPASQKKPKKNWALRIIIPVAVAAITFAVGYFATGAHKLKHPTPFEEKSPKFEIDNLDASPIENMPSIKETDATVQDTRVLDQKVYSFSVPGAESRVFFNYHEDGTVQSIAGSVAYKDLSLVDAIESLKSDTSFAKKFLKEIAAPPASYVELYETSSSVQANFSFCDLKNNSELAELAAAYIGFRAENGKIMIDKVDTEMTKFGYVLE